MGLITILFIISLCKPIEGLPQLGDPIKLNGTLSVGGFTYSANGIQPRQPNFGYSLSTQMNAQIYGVSIPIYASINEQGSQFQNPFNRFGISPKYKWAQLHLGWRNMQFSQFTLQGVTFLGVGAQLTPGKWRISGMYGRFQRATNGTNRNYPQPRYERKGYAAKIGYGSSLNFFEFNLFKAKDDLSSVTVADSININAQENLSVGLTTQFEIIPKYLQVGAELGLSGFTENLRADTLPQEAERYIENIAWAYEPNISSHFNYAIESFVRFKLNRFEISGNFRRIMPEYKTLGANYLLNDLEALTIQPSFRNKINALSISASIGNQKNNLDGWRQNENNRWIGSAQLDYNPRAPLGFHFQYSNYSFNQQVLRDSLNADSLQLNQVNQNIVFIPRFIIQKSRVNHIFIFNYNGQQLQDNSTVEGIDVSNRMHMVNLNYSLNHKASRSQLSIGSNYFLFESGPVRVERAGINIGYNKRLWKKRLQLRLNSGYQQSLRNIDHHLYVSLHSTINVYKNMNISLQSRWRRAKINLQDQEEIRTELRLTQRF